MTLRVRSAITLFIPLIVTLLLSGCGRSEPALDTVAAESQPNQSTQEEEQSDFIAMGNTRIAWDGSNNEEEFEASYRIQDHLQLKIHTEDEEMLLDLTKVAFPDKMNVIALQEGVNAIAITLDYHEPAATIELPINERWAYLIIGKQNGKLAVLLNTIEDKTHQENNYQITFDRKGYFQIIDNLTQFKVDFNVEIDDEYEHFYRNLSEDENPNLFQPANWFTQINPILTNSKFEIEYIKMIPGVRSRKPLGFFSYHYNWIDSQFALTKETFFTAPGVFIENPKVLKEQQFTQEK